MEDHYVQIVLFQGKRYLIMQINDLEMLQFNYFATPLSHVGVLLLMSAN